MQYKGNIIQKLLNDINKISYQLLIEEPFYGHLFVGFVKKEIKQKFDVSFVPSREFIEFVFEPEFWFKQTAKVKKGLIKHELLHLVYKHPLRARDYAMKNIYYLASDLVVNQNLQADELALNAFTLEFLTKYGVSLEGNRAIDYYYDALMVLLEESLLKKTVLCHLYNKEGESLNDNKKEATKELELLEILEDRTFCAAHINWREFEKEQIAKNGLLEHNLNHLFINVSNRMFTNNSWGNVSDELRSYLGEIVLYKSPKVDWKKALKIFVASSQKSYLKNTVSRVSKRYGTTPGIKIKRRNRLCVVIDTSGSLNDSDLREYFHEIYHIWKQNCEIMIVECDEEIQRVYKYKGQVPSYVQGRGGTNFDPPITYNNNVFKGDAIIYFTDGQAPSPTIKSRMPIFWLIYNNTKLTNPLTGRVVFMKN